MPNEKTADQTWSEVGQQFKALGESPTCCYLSHHGERRPRPTLMTIGVPKGNS